MVKPESPNDAASEPKTLRARLRLWVAWSVQYWRELLDFRFDKYLIVQVLPGVYGLLLFAIAITLLFLTVIAFRTNIWYGLYTLLVVTPVGFLVAASVLRAVLEFYLVVFRISENVDELVGIRDTVDRLSNIGKSVDQMVSVTRHIPFLDILTSRRSKDQGEHTERRQRDRRAESNTENRDKPDEKS